MAVMPASSTIDELLPAAGLLMAGTRADPALPVHVVRVEIQLRRGGDVIDSGGQRPDRDHSLPVLLIGVSVPGGVFISPPRTVGERGCGGFAVGAAQQERRGAGGCGAAGPAKDEGQGQGDDLRGMEDPRDGRGRRGGWLPAWWPLARDWLALACPSLDAQRWAGNVVLPAEPAAELPTASRSLRNAGVTPCASSPLHRGACPPERRSRRTAVWRAANQDMTRRVRPWYSGPASSCFDNSQLPSSKEGRRQASPLFVSPNRARRRHKYGPDGQPSHGGRHVCHFCRVRPDPGGLTLAAPARRAIFRCSGYPSCMVMYVT